MALPNQELGDALESVLPQGTNLYRGLTNQVVSPAIVIRPDDPWFDNQEAPSWCFDQQRWTAVAVAHSAAPEDAQGVLYRLVRSVIHNLPEQFSWINTSGVVLDESTGTAFLAVAIHLRYNSMGEEEES